jgi:thymidylate kinase
VIIAIEGVDGVGKTTLAKTLANRLGAVYQKFPDRTTISGSAIDYALRGRPASSCMSAECFQALNTVNRLECLEHLTKAAGSATNHLVCDRYTMSSLVYGGLDGLPHDWLVTVAEKPLPEADLQVLLTANPNKIECGRLAGRDREHYEQGGVAIVTALQARFEALWCARGCCCEPVLVWGHRWKVVDTSHANAAEVLCRVEGWVQFLIRRCHENKPGRLGHA